MQQASSDNCRLPRYGRLPSVPSMPEFGTGARLHIGNVPGVAALVRRSLIGKGRAVQSVGGTGMGEYDQDLPQLVHLNGNLLAAIDLETTGLQAGYHEPIQIAVVPLNTTSDRWKASGRSTPPSAGVSRAAGEGVGYVHGLNLEDLILHSPDAGKVADLLVEWWEKLDLPFGKTLVPLAHNWAFECEVPASLVGRRSYHHAVPRARTGRHALCTGVERQGGLHGLPCPFAKVGLGSICKHFKVSQPFAA